MNELNDHPTAVKPAKSTNEYRPRFSIYHPNGKGTGGAFAMELHPAHGNEDGCIRMHLAAQKTIGDYKGPVKKFATFDWNNRICVKLNFSDICRILQVLRGETDMLENGKGIYHRSSKYSTRIVFRHLTEPVHGYSLEVYRDTLGQPSEVHSVHLVINQWEALGIGIALEHSIGIVCFGTPRNNTLGGLQNEQEDEYEPPAA